MDGESPAVERPEMLECDACGAEVRPWNLKLSKSGEALCPQCVKRTATSGRIRWFVVGGAALVFVAVVVSVLVSRLSYLQGPEPDLKALNALASARDSEGMEAYYDTAGFDACFRPLEATHNPNDVSDAKKLAIGSFRNIRVAYRDGNRAVATAVWGQANPKGSVGLKRIEYSLVETAPGQWKVVSVTNAAQLVSEYASYMDEMGM